MRGCKMGLLIIGLILMGCLLGNNGVDGANKKVAVGASFIFGDSLVDAGNNNYLPTLSKANLRPNGIDYKPSGGNPTGRFTNGRTIGDIVGEELGIPNHAVPFLDPNATGKAILYGVNYASGGGGILNATGRIFVSTLSFTSNPS